MSRNGNGMKRQFDDAYGAPPSVKRLRTESRVVFVRGLPPDCLESELLALCCPFAVVEKCLLIPPKRSAFVQLPDVASAANLLAFYETRDALIRGYKILFEFSNRDEILVRPEFDRDLQTPYNSQDASFGDTNGLAPPRRGIGEPNTILMVGVSKIQYDVTVDVLQQVFQKFGSVHKVVCFWKNDEFKALVQMETIEQAQAAQAALDGRDIYTGCNTLSIVFSKHDELRVRHNSERSRDFTNPNLPVGSPPRGGEGPGGGSYDLDRRDDRRDDGRAAPSPRQSSPLRRRDSYDSDYRGPGPAAGGFDDRGRDRGRDRGGPYRSDSRDRDRDRDRDRSRDRSRDRDRDRDRGRRPPSPPPLSRYGTSLAPSGDRVRDPPPVPGGVPVRQTGRTMRNDIPPSPVLICSNMDRALATPDRLFTFFGCFGDVLRVKIMFRKQDTALIQFAGEDHATSALEHADSLVLFGRKLRVDYSKHTSVSMPRGSVDQFELENTVDFTDSPMHRYRRRSLQEAVSPCPLLHVSCIPQELQRVPNALPDLFARHGQLKSFRFLRDNKMALVEMGSVDDAVMAVVLLHNLPFPDANLRVSFSNAFHPQLGRDRGPRDRSRDRGPDRDRPPMGGRRDRSRGRDRPPPGRF